MKVLIVPILLVIVVGQAASIETTKHEYICYSRLTDGYWQIWLHDLETKQGRQLTTSKMDKLRPAWIEHLQQLVYTTPNDEFFLLDLMEQEHGRILDDYGYIADPCWLPTGNKLVFVKYRTSMMDISDLWIANVDGGDRRLIPTNPGFQSTPSTSRDGRKIVFTSGQGFGNFEIHCYNLMDGSVSQITHNESLEAYSRISPDGSKLAYASDISGNWDIWLSDIDGGNPRALSASTAFDSYPNWSPDGTRVVFHSTRTGRLQVFAVVVATGRQNQIIFAKADSRDPVWFRTDFLTRQATQSFVRISEVKVEPKVFDFEVGSEVSISLRLNEPATVGIGIHDSGHRVAGRLASNVRKEAGRHSFAWNGRNDAGEPVHDGVYLFTIEAEDGGHLMTYDPYLRTYGHQITKERFDYDREERKISFVLPRAAMVRVSVGLSDGGLYKTIAEWHPETAGRKTYLWDGYDRSHIINLSSHPKLIFYTTAYTLADNSIIVRNSPNGASEARHVPRAASGAFPHAFHDRRFCREPRFNVEIVEECEHNEDGLPIVKGKVPIRISLGKNDKRLISERFEILFFEDSVFIFEDEDAPDPFNYYWDTAHLNDGTHILTVNIVGYQDHIGIESLEVEVRNHVED